MKADQQRRAAVFFSKFERRFGRDESCVVATRGKEVWMKMLILNILVVTGEQVEEELRATC